MVRILALVLLVACGRKDETPELIASTQHRVKQIAFESFPMWSRAHPDKACPGTIQELEGGKFTDPWQHPLKMVCGKGRFAVFSLGPDGIEGTPDDIQSGGK